MSRKGFSKKRTGTWPGQAWAGGRERVPEHLYPREKAGGCGAVPGEGDGGGAGGIQGSGQESGCRRPGR